MSGEKTHAPTQKRLDDARKRGEVSQSKEIPILLKYAVFLLLLQVSFDYGWSRLKDFVGMCIAFVRYAHEQSLAALFDSFFGLTLLVLAIWVCPLVFSGVTGIFMQIGILFSAEAAKPSFKKFDVVGNIKNMVSGQTLIQLLLTLLKVIIFIWVAVRLVYGWMPDTLQLQRVSLSVMGDFALDHLRTLLMLSLMLFAAFAAIDWFVTRTFFIRKMRMSHQDMVDEHKQTEGDPHVKSHRRQEHRSILNSSLSKVGQAKVVVNNPTHISVALDYEPGVHDLPFILAIETDDMALLMRRKALEMGIPLVTHVKLARALLRDGEVDAYIPSECVALTAEVFRHIMEQMKALEESQTEQQQAGDKDANPNDGTLQ